MYLKLEKVYAKQAVKALLKVESTDVDIVDQICLIFDTVAKRVSLPFFHSLKITIQALSTLEL